MATRSSNPVNVPKEDLNYLLTVPTGYITDSLLRLQIGEWISDLLPVNSLHEVHLAGPAYTVQFVPKYNAKYKGIKLYELISGVPQGSVLVIQGGYTGFTIGENVTTAALMANLQGIVIDGYVRDIHALRQLPINVFSRGPKTQPLVGFDIVAENISIVCGGATINPGDIIAGDNDGLVVIPEGRLKEVMAQVYDIAELEKEQNHVIRSQGSLEELREVLRLKTRVV